MAGWLLGKSPLRITAVGILLAAFVGVLNYFAGHEYSVGIFYLIPIFLVSWGAGTWGGLLLCLISAALWLAADMASGRQYSSEFVLIGNTTLRLALLVATTYMVGRIRKARDIQAVLARVDPVTGIPNRRAFLEISDRECRRVRRNKRPVTLAYIAGLYTFFFLE